MDDREFRRPSNGRPLLYMRPLPDWIITQYSLGGEQTINYTTNQPIGIVPLSAAPGMAFCARVSMAFRTAESGADSSNYTQLEVRAGNAASYSVVATLDTQSGPASLEAVTADVQVYLDPGDTIFAYWTRQGTGSVNYANDFGFVSLDVAVERLP